MGGPKRTWREGWGGGAKEMIAGGGGRGEVKCTQWLPLDCGSSCLFMSTRVFFCLEASSGPKTGKHMSAPGPDQLLSLYKQLNMHRLVYLFISIIFYMYILHEDITT